ncbi:hypothetical protein VOLCADRAFT_99980 [Volvox carteri f. nagariensis]|uniref:Alpha-2-macroglobulin domain-containing protein n=1 Tax=Volvox carteri f. nagariensis TaxID=3068 RepID=D8UJ48_VOLCA|nr:uncharacterized protein VOLCADRAFT_99980 [Volvox carteri f. nagariensis]EFJ40250.1 hypothetical protein VOLCADRAFT_99980 [Volvox carteri f. nagariensis]|eukprot:XP_002958690.1 hypothetical protein VOLCADRAFT_99980 [Volvox carteri f. nagariensis]
MAVDTPDDVYLAKYTSFITYSGPLTKLPAATATRALPLARVLTPSLITYLRLLFLFLFAYVVDTFVFVLVSDLDSYRTASSRTLPGNHNLNDATGSIALGGSRPDERGDGPIPSPSLALLRRVGQFVVTPLFTHVLADSTGRATFNFTAPQNLGTFVIRAFAAAGSVAKYGSGESKLVVRRSLSLTPSVPAFVRVGDVFEGGVVVTVGSAPATVTVSLQVLSGNSLRVVGTLVKQVTFTGGSGGDLQEERASLLKLKATTDINRREPLPGAHNLLVRFNFNATAVGTTSLVFSASDGVLIGGGRDSLQLEIDVEGQQGAVWIATSYPLAGAATPSNPTNSTVSWVDGLELPATVPGSGGLTLSAGVGYLPALAALYDNILVSESWRTEPYAQPAVLWATLPAVLSYYGQTVNGSQATEVTAAVSDLNTLTDPVYGLCWTTYSRFSGWWTRRTDVYLNTWALFVVNFHAAVVPSVVPDVLAPKWRQALETQVVADDWEARSYNSSYSDWNMLAWIRLALGADWKPDAVASADNLTLWHVSLERTLAVYRDQETRWQFDRQTRMVLSLVLLSMGDENPEPGLVDETVTEVVSSLHTQGRTVYLGVGPGISATASPEEQALALLLLLRSGVDVPAFTSRLANYIASPSSAGRGGGIFLNLYPSLSAQALAVAALTEYDRSRGSSEPNLDLRASVGSLNVLQASFRVNETRPVTSYTTWEAMPPSSRGKPRLLSVEANGTGEAFLSAAIRFIPVALPPFPTYRGIAVELVVQLVDPLTGRPTGPHLAAVPLGSVVALTVQLTTPDDLSAVTLSVMMPGGLEPMDPNLVPDAASPCFISWFGSNEWQYCFPRWWWWPVCPAQETRPSLVTFSYAALRAGTTTATVKAVAATAGTFVVPPVRASVDEQPEVMGMTAGGSLTVCDGCSGATPAPPPRAPKACPADCSGNGVCNLLRGMQSCIIIIIIIIIIIVTIITIITIVTIIITITITIITIIIIIIIIIVIAPYLPSSASPFFRRVP